MCRKMMKLVAYLSLLFVQFCAVPQANADVTTLEIRLRGTGSALTAFQVDLTQSTVTVWRGGRWESVSYSRSEAAGGYSTDFVWSTPVAGVSENGVAWVLFDLRTKGIQHDGYTRNTWRRLRFMVKQDPFLPSRAKDSGAVFTAEIFVSYDSQSVSQTGHVPSSQVDPVVWVPTDDGDPGTGGQGEPCEGPTYDPFDCDSDDDGKVDVCDPDSLEYDPSICDSDCDGIVNVCDPSHEDYNPFICDSDDDGTPDRCDPDSPAFEPGPCFESPFGVAVPEHPFGFDDNGELCDGEEPDPDPDPDPPGGGGGGAPGGGIPQPPGGPGTEPPLDPVPPPVEPPTPPGPAPNPPPPTPTPPEPPTEDECCKAITWWLASIDQRLYYMTGELDAIRVNTHISADDMARFRRYDFPSFRAQNAEQSLALMSYMEQILTFGETLGQIGTGRDLSQGMVSPSRVSGWIITPGTGYAMDPEGVSGVADNVREMDWDNVWQSDPENDFSLDGRTYGLEEPPPRFEDELTKLLYGEVAEGESEPSGGLVQSELVSEFEAFVDEVPELDELDEAPVWDFNLSFNSWFGFLGGATMPNMVLHLDWEFWTPYRELVRDAIMLVMGVWGLLMIWDEVKKR